jgi:hypothetical protein
MSPPDWSSNLWSIIPLSQCSNVLFLQFQPTPFFILYFHFLSFPHLSTEEPRWEDSIMTYHSNPRTAYSSNSLGVKAVASRQAALMLLLHPAPLGIPQNSLLRSTRVVLLEILHLLEMAQEVLE